MDGVLLKKRGVLRTINQACNNQQWIREEGIFKQIFIRRKSKREEPEHKKAFEKSLKDSSRPCDSYE
jgi:hypothetical protein